MFDENLNENDKIQRNKVIYKLLSIDVTVIGLPAILIIWVEAGLAFHEILMLQGIFTLTVLLAEVPSGALSDSWSRKGTISSHYLLLAAAFGVYTLANSFIGFAIAEIICGIALALNTGSDSALLFETLKKSEEKHNYGKIISQRMTIMFIGAAIGSIAGGYIAELTMIRLPLVLVVIGHSLFAIISLGYIEINSIKETTMKSSTKNALGIISRNSIIQIVIIYSMTFLIFGKSGFWAGQVLLADKFMVGTIGIGIAIALLNITAATTSYLIRKKIDDLTKLSTIFILLAIDTIYFLILITNHLDLLGFMVLAMSKQISRGSRTPILQIFVQKNCNDTERATMTSFISLIGSLGYFVFSTVVDIFKLSLNMIMIVCFISMVLMSALILLRVIIPNENRLREPKTPQIT